MSQISYKIISKVTDVFRLQINWHNFLRAILACIIFGASLMATNTSQINQVLDLSEL
jgi:hypothetical protein